MREWPRPPEDNGLGIHAGLRFQNIERDLAHCLYMGLKWVLLCHGSQDELIRAGKLFWANGIMPVFRPYILVNDNFGWREFASKVADALGFSPYIQVFNEPSDTREWRNSKRPKYWLEYFASKWPRAANNVALGGGLPGLQVLDTKELRAVLQVGWHEKAWFCPHNYGLKFPPDYYARDEGESIGVLSFLDFAHVFLEVTKDTEPIPPFICGEGGWFFGGMGNDQHAEWTTQLFSSFRYGVLPNEFALPDYLFAVCPWILSGGIEGWYGWWEATKTIEAARAMSDFVRHTVNIPETVNNWRVVSPWMVEDEALEDLATLGMTGFHDYRLEERK